jgi:hypothetical protein
VQTQHVDGLVSDRVDNAESLPEAILERHGGRRHRGHKGRIHELRVMRKLCRSQIAHLAAFFVGGPPRLTEATGARRNLS